MAGASNLCIHPRSSGHVFVTFPAPAPSCVLSFSPSSTLLHAVKDQFDLMTKMAGCDLSKRLSPQQVKQHPLMTVGPAVPRVLSIFCGVVVGCERSQLRSPSCCAGLVVSRCSDRFVTCWLMLWYAASKLVRDSLFLLV